MLPFLGITAGIITCVSQIPYLTDTLRHKTKPERASWLIWSVLGTIAFFSQQAQGADWSLWLTFADTLGVVIIFLLSIKFGEGGFSLGDKMALTAAGIGLLAWGFTKQPLAALVITIFIDASGAIPTITKAYRKPESETLISWLGVAAAGVLSTVSVGKFDPGLWLYPAYIFLANFAVAVAIWLGKNKSR
jgi:hypothetical protein